MVRNQKIALLFFSRNAKAESRQKSFFHGAAKENLSLCSALILRSSRIIQSSGLPVFHYDEQNQSGSSFGERLANAYQDIFDLGYDGVIAVGNDSPQLGRINWNLLIRQLSDGECILGPDYRHGAYLIGLTAKIFDKEKFAQLPWQSGRLFDALCDFCSAENDQKAPLRLQKLRDVNSTSDIQKLRYDPLLDRSFKTFLLVLCRMEKQLPDVPDQLYKLLNIFSNSPLRAPPSL